MPGQIVTIDLGTVPVGVTAFNLEFLPFGGVWTDYSTASATPSAPQDLSVGLLTGSIYPLDGVNGPTGNEEAASAAGVLYRARWKTGSTYGNWSRVPFADGSALVPDVWADAWTGARQLLYPGGRAIPTDDPLLLYGSVYELARVIAFVEGPPAPDGTGGTGRSFTATPGTRAFTGNGRMVLAVPDFVPASAGGTALTVVADSVTVTGVIPLQAEPGRLPWNRLALGAGASIARWPATAYGNVSVTATWGFDLTVPIDLAGAVALEVVRRVIMGADAPIDGITSWHDADRTVSYNPELIWKTLAERAPAFQEILAQYRNQEALWRAQGIPEGAIRLMAGRP